jgi:hypothetical protein
LKLDDELYALVVGDLLKVLSLLDDSPLYILSSTVSTGNADTFHVVEVVFLIEVASGLTIVVIVIQVDIDPATIVVEDVYLLNAWIAK